MTGLCCSEPLHFARRYDLDDAYIYERYTDRYGSGEMDEPGKKNLL